MANNDPEHSSPRRGALLAMVAVAVLLACGWWLEQRMHANSIMEDCLMAGRRNCAPIAVPPPK